MLSWKPSIEDDGSLFKGYQNVHKYANLNKYFLTSLMRRNNDVSY